MADDYSTVSVSEESSIRSAVSCYLPTICYQFGCDQDIAQQVRIRLHKHGDKYTSEKGSYEGWVHAITKNEVRSHIKKCHLRLLHNSIDTGGHNNGEGEIDVPELPETISAEEWFLAKDLLEKILHQLAPQERELAQMLAEKLPTKEIASHYKVSVSTMNVRIFRFRQRLKEQFIHPKQLPALAPNI